MAFTANLLLNNPPPGDPAQFSNWGTMENTGRTLVDAAVGGVLPLAVTGGITVLTSNNGAPDQARNAHFNCTGVLTSNQTMLWPQGCGRMFSVTNSTTGAFSLILGANNGSGAVAGATVTVPRGVTYLCYSDGTNVILRQTGFKGTYLDITGGGSISGALTVGGAFSSGASISSGGDFICQSTGQTTVISGVGISVDLGNFDVIVGGSGGVRLPSGGTSWVSLSERAKKKDFAPISKSLEITRQHSFELGRYIEDGADRPLRAFIFYEDARDYWQPAQVHTDAYTAPGAKPGTTRQIPEFNGVAKEEYLPLFGQNIKDLVDLVEALTARVAALEARP